MLQFIVLLYGLGVITYIGCAPNVPQYAQYNRTTQLPTKWVVMAFSARELEIIGLRACTSIALATISVILMLVVCILSFMVCRHLSFAWWLCQILSMV